MHTIEKFMARQFVINCETQEEAKILMDILMNHGYLWCSSDSLENTEWHQYESQMCYLSQRNWRRLEYGRKAFFESLDYKVVKFSEIIRSEYSE